MVIEFKKQVKGESFGDVLAGNNDNEVVNAPQGLALRPDFTGNHQVLAESQPLSFEAYRELARRHSQGETAFWRYPQAFARLIKHFAAWRQEGKEKLRFLSCPCSVGLEPLSLMACAMQAGYSPSQIEIVAVDINPKLLALAREGYYWATIFNCPHYEDLQLCFSFYQMPDRRYSIVWNEEIKKIMALVFDFEAPALDSFPVAVKPNIKERICYVEADLLKLKDQLKDQAIIPHDFDLFCCLNPRAAREVREENILQWAMMLVGDNGLVAATPVRTYGGNITTEFPQIRRFGFYDLEVQIYQKLNK